MDKILYLFFFLLSLGQLGRISFFNQQVNVYLYEIFLVFLLIWVFIKVRFEPLKKSFKQFKSVYIFLAALLVSNVLTLGSFNGFQNLVGLLYFLRLLLYFMIFFYLKDRFSGFSKGIFIFATITAIASLVQYFFYPDLRNLFYLGWDPHLYRVFGLFFDTSSASAIYGLVFLLFILRYKNIELRKEIKLTFLFLYSIFGILSFSRIFYISILLTLFIFLIRKKLYSYLFLVILVFSLLLYFAPKPQGEGVNLTRVFSIVSRTENYKTALDIWKKNPIFGAGYNKLRYIKEKVTTPSHSGASFHSSFLIILATSGIIGLVAFLFVLLRLAKISDVSLYHTLFLSIFSLGDNILLQPFVLILFLIFLLFELNLSTLSRR